MQALVAREQGVRGEALGAEGARKGLEARLVGLAAVLLQLLLGGEALLARGTPVGTLARVRAHVPHHRGRVHCRVRAELAHQPGRQGLRLRLRLA